LANEEKNTVGILYTCLFQTGIVPSSKAPRDLSARLDRVANGLSALLNWPVAVLHTLLVQCVECYRVRIKQQTMAAVLS